VSDPFDARCRHLRLPIFSAALALALATPAVAAAQASAATISVPEPCVINAGSSGSQMLAAGAGFTPGDLIELTTNHGSGFGSTTADANGGFQVAMTGPVLSKAGPAVSTFTLIATDQTDGVTTATAPFEAANLAVATNPARAKPNKKVRYTFSGFTSGAEIYAHYLHGRKVAATARFGRASGPCGVLKAKAKLYPGRQRYTTYTVQFDDARRYSAKSLPNYVTSLNVFKF
jgi:hypothetical protein